MRVRLLVFAASALIPATALAEEPANGAVPELHVPRPSDETCIDIAYRDVSPATFELSPALDVGVAARSSEASTRGRFSLGAVVEGTFRLTNWDGQRRGGGDAFEVRAGPWLGFETPLDVVRGEGGLAMTFGQIQHARWGTFGLRLGAGRGSDAENHVVGTLTWGVRYVPGRIHPEYGACSAPSEPRAFALVSGARLFATLRESLAPSFGDRYEIVAGIEFEPSFFLPPYSGAKWIGFHTSR